MDFFLWGWHKKVFYYEDYKVLAQIKYASVATFHQVAGKFVTSTVVNFVKRLNPVVEPNGDQFKNIFCFQEWNDSIITSKL